MSAELAGEVKRRQEAEQQVKVIQQQLAEEAERMATITAHQTAALENTRRALDTEKQLCDELKRYFIHLLLFSINYVNETLKCLCNAQSH